MILHPEPARSSGLGVVPAWQAVARTQQTTAPRYKLIHQPDHAHLAGELVQHFVIPGAPALSDEIVRGIWAHDEGWREFDRGEQKFEATHATYSNHDVPLNTQGKPISFLEVNAGDALRAWDASIEHAESVGATAGLIVSGHFYRLAQTGLQMKRYSPDEEEFVRLFLQTEERRYERLLKRQSRTQEEISYWTDFLRFCDLLSLYLCSGAQESVEFPERLGPQQHSVQLLPSNGARQFTPSIFDQQTEFIVTAYGFPDGDSTTLHFTLR